MNISMSGEFKETSRLFRPWFLFSMLPILFLLVVLFIIAVQKQDTADIIIIGLSILMLLTVIVILLIPRLELCVGEDGIGFKYIPYHRQLVTYTWDEIQSVEVLTINPLAEFLGWGRKYSQKYGTGYLTQGGHILYVCLKDGGKISFTVLDRRRAAAFLAERSIVEG